MVAYGDAFIARHIALFNNTLVCSVLRSNQVQEFRSRGHIAYCCNHPLTGFQQLLDKLQTDASRGAYDHPSLGIHFR